MSAPGSSSEGVNPARGFPLHLQIFVGMALGALIGLPLNFAANAGTIDRSVVLTVGAGGEWAGKVFLTLLNMVVVPLVAASIVAALTRLGGDGGLGRLGSRTVGYYLLTSTLAIATGIVLVNVIRPGDGIDFNTLMIAAKGELQSRAMAAPDVTENAGKGVWVILADIVMRTVPNNVVEAARSNGSILSVLFFSVCFGAAAAATGGEAAEHVERFAGAIYDVTLTLTLWILKLAPVGIAAYVLFVTATTGLSLVWVLIWYMVTVFVGLLIHAGLTLPVLLWGFTRRNPLHYALQVKEALLTAFSTASSAGTLPLTIACVGVAGVQKRVSAFVLPLGATVNMDGTALYEAVAVLFVSQMLGDLSLGQQLIVAFTALLASVGAAGIPHAGLVMMVVVMQAVGLPTDTVLIILAVDRVLDMCRTAVNVWSDMVGAAVIAAFEPDEAVVASSA